MARTVADVLVGTLEEIGVRQIFGLIGDSLNPLADAVRRSQIEWIGVRHEEGAALAASGQAKLTGRLAACARRSGGGQGFKAEKPGELQEAIRAALAADGPAIVDAVVVGNEMPNIPHLELDLLGKFALAKIKEAVLAVTGA
jgi:thiamine pyrophosphate-dependent acetolactate synthase large subunit-like protein